MQHALHEGAHLMILLRPCEEPQLCATWSNRSRPSTCGGRADDGRDPHMHPGQAGTHLHASLRKVVQGGAAHAANAHHYDLGRSWLSSAEDPPCGCKQTGAGVCWCAQHREQLS